MIVKNDRDSSIRNDNNLLFNSAVLNQLINNDIRKKEKS